MSGFHWKVDRRALASAIVRKKCGTAVADLTDHLLEAANRTVPIEEGTLQNSGRATTKGLKGVVSYNTPYACRQHEEMGYRHDSGRRAKWLEMTFKEEQPRALAYLAKRIDL